ncbi:cytoplasmic protein [Mangrovibacter yixingensis]|uniref:cytoplasmic protein n=1 Tax=Mangrovibacter yixingensis TaxID=1529639 RepID=UPI001CFC7408|nr:cytoplasmic protein [Mangrovibacter yixingensis]
MSEQAQPINKNFALNNENKHQFILSRNLQSLRLYKNEVVDRYTRKISSIPAALVELKWQNRKSLYAFQVKEEVYGSVLCQLLANNPELKEKVMARIEAHYQQFRTHEAQTLEVSRKLVDGQFKTSSAITN